MVLDSMIDRKQELVAQISQLTDGLTARSRIDGTDSLSDEDLTLPQVRVLYFLSGGPKRTGEVAKAMGVALPNASTMIERLVKKSLVERSTDSDDRRRVLVALTMKGLKIIEEFSRINQLRVEKVAAVLSVDELETVARAMEILAIGVDRLTAMENEQ